jgi:AraC family transcriptional activator FtrA
VIVDEGTNPFEVGVATELFGLPRPELGRPEPLYELTLCTPTPGVRMNHGFFTLSGVPGLDAVDDADTLVVPGRPDNVVPRRPAVLDAIQRSHALGARVVSFCTGSFALAEAGLLDGRRATTHWRYADEFARRFPSVDVDPNVLYIEDGPVWTSAGSAAGLDLALHVVRRDFGADIANAVARRLVVQPHRDGGQAQFIEAPVTADPDDDRIAASIDWALANLAHPISVDTLARQAHMSTRTYIRHFARCTGTSPIRWLINQRVHASLALLETTRAPIEEIARAVGFDTGVTYRHHFARAMRGSPSAHRRAFRADAHD